MEELDQAIEKLTQLRIKALKAGNTEMEQKLYDIEQLIFKHQDHAPVWIPCSERLPEFNTDVFIYTDSGISIGVYDGFLSYLKKPGFYDLQMWNEIYGYEEDETVTHWMPLPNAPEKDKK